MGDQTFKIPRWNDKQIIKIMKEVVSEFSFQDARLYFIPFEGASSKEVSFTELEKNEELKTLLDINATSIYYYRLNYKGKQLFNIKRDGKSLFDDLTYNWGNIGAATVSELDFARLIGFLKRKYKEVKLDEAFSGFPNEEINKYYEARDATLTRLETTTTELLFGMQKRQVELDQKYQERSQELENKILENQKALQKEFEAKEQKLAEKEEAFKEKEAEFETHESKYIRRQLRQDLLKRLAELSQKFELTKDTRKLRTPIFVVTSIFIIFFGVLTVLSFSQAVEILSAAAGDANKINWWILGVLALKQLAFASAFIGGTWFLIKWNDRWFRQHADAEFNFKQLELDINRASWVVEMALEWKDEKGKELPPELLDRLTKNLFKDVSQPNADADSPPDIASLLLGSASSVKFKAGNGTEIEYDRKGIKNVIKDE